MKQLRSAAGPDGIVSRRDVRARLRKLEGAEQALVDVLYRFIDDRDAAPSARVTRSAIPPPERQALAVRASSFVERFTASCGSQPG